MGITVRNNISSFPLTFICISVPGMFDWFAGHRCLIEHDVGYLANAAFHSEWEVPCQGDWIYPLLYTIDKAWWNIKQTLPETGPEFNDTILALIRNLGFTLLTAFSGIIMPFSLRLVKSRRIDRGKKTTCVRPGLLDREWRKSLIGFDWNTASIYIHPSFWSVHLLNIRWARLCVRKCSRYNDTIANRTDKISACKELTF